MTEQPPINRQPIRADRPQMPAGYEIPLTPPNTDKYPWAGVVEQLIAARNYWVCTTYPDGRPHAMPVWGLWLNDAVYFSSDPNARRSRNLSHNPHVIIHLESGDNVVILEGVIGVVFNRDLPAAYADDYEAKYNFRPDTSKADEPGAYFLRPQKVLTWLESDFHGSAVRWHFEEQR